MEEPDRRTSFPMSSVHRPPRDGYFDRRASRASVPHTPGTPGTPGTPWSQIYDRDNVEQTPLASPEHNPLSYSSRLSMSVTRHSTIPRDIEIQSLIQHRSGMISAWGIHWWIPFSLIALFLLGVMGALTHHAFYRVLDGQEAKNQLWMGRIGTAMAFFTKTSLVGCVVLSYKQRIWYSLRRRGMTVGAIDGLFAVTEDPTQFFKWEMLIGAKIAVLMAISVWLIPLAAVFSPTTLTSTLGTRDFNGTCSQVPNLNFSAEMDANYRNPRRINGGFGVALSYWNTTDPNGTAPGFFDYYDQPSKNAVRIATISAFMDRAIAKDNANVQACGSASWNCSYSITFPGPGYMCAQLASGVGANVSELARLGAPFNTSTLVPEGFNIYQAVVGVGDYATIQTPTDDHGVPFKPYPDDLGVFKSEPILWIGHSVDTGNPLQPDSPYASSWKTEHIPKIFACQHYYTNYIAKVGFAGGQQYVNITHRQFVSPIIDTELAQLPNGTVDASTALPEANWVRPNTDVGKYKLTAAYHTLGLLLRRQLQGTIDLQNQQPRTKTEASATRLVNQTNFYPVPDLQTQVQTFYEAMILSLVSDPQLIVGTTSSVPCVRTRRINMFKYYPEGLWIGYALVITITFFFLIVGFHAMVDNGVASDTVFSRIMTTTRNPTLDHLSVGACLGSDPFPKELERTKLRFGVLDEENLERREDDVWVSGVRVGHCAFGTEDQIGPIVKGRSYAGLRSRWKD